LAAKFPQVSQVKARWIPMECVSPLERKKHKTPGGAAESIVPILWVRKFATFAGWER
jgi:hypothetical protein